MDIRDVTFRVEELPQEFRNGQYLEALIYLQKQLLVDYQKIESLADYPIDINTKSGQTLIKDFIARVIEECGEAMESYYQANTKISNGHSPKTAHNDLINFNEELADALHFFLELLIYVNFHTDEHFSPFLLSKAEHLKVKIVPGGDTISNMAILAKVEAKLAKRTKHYTISIPLDIADLAPGGRSFSDKIINTMEVTLWKMVYYLQISRNTLKNKPWKQTQMLTDVKVFYAYLAEALYQFMLFNTLVGISPLALLKIYALKNKVNRFRINSKY